MAATKHRPQKRGKSKAVVWIVLGCFVFGFGVLALNVTQRFRRAVTETNQVKNVLEEAERRKEMAVKSPARKEFSPAFLQMAFGDNPPLLEQIKEALSKALGDQPTLAQGDLAMMLVTYRAEGELRDVAIQIFGNLIPENLPSFSTEGYWKAQLPSLFYQMGQSSLTLLGRHVLILAKQDVEKKQREVIDAGINDQYPVIRDYLQDPVSFIAVIPEPSRLFSDRFRPYMAAVLIKGKVSMGSMHAEMVALSFDQRKAQELAQLLSDTRMMAVGVGRLRFGAQGQGEIGLESLARSQIHTEGPTVVATTMISGETIERGLPRIVRGISKGIGRIRRGPGYPS